MSGFSYLRCSKLLSLLVLLNLELIFLLKDSELARPSSSSLLILILICSAGSAFGYDSFNLNFAVSTSPIVSHSSYATELVGDFFYAKLVGDFLGLSFTALGLFFSALISSFLVSFLGDTVLLSSGYYFSFWFPI